MNKTAIAPSPTRSRSHQPENLILKRDRASPTRSRSHQSEN
ncbi:hypothetical protein [Dactylococcopsis salina]|nr:hypothetical protein [Dactylococcopsis salina]